MKHTAREFDISLWREFVAMDDAGNFTWLKKPNRNISVGSPAGTKRPDGYVVLSLNRHRVLAHRLVWAFTHGRLPKGEIDHIDGNPANNRLDNLREATHAQNIQSKRMKSAPSPYGRGVTKRNNKYHARIVVMGEVIRLGSFSTSGEAAASYARAAAERFGEFARA